MIQRYGRPLLFHEGVIEELRKRQAATLRAEQTDSQGFGSNANVKLFRALSHCLMDTQQDSSTPCHCSSRAHATGGSIVYETVYQPGMANGDGTGTQDQQHDRRHTKLSC